MRTSRLPLLGLVAVALLLSLGACSTTEPAGQQIDDAALATKVKAKIAADPETNPFEIDVDVNDGVVTLRGRVEEAGDRTEAEKLARNTSGVRRVVNRITVGEDPHDDPPGSDGAITLAIKTKLAADPDVAAVNIDVDVTEGVVTLSGTVKSQAARQKAHDIAHSVSGVKRVNNELKVG